MSIIKSEFIYETAPFPSCHAATLVETKKGIVAGFFGGTHERHPDVCIWVCRLINGIWTAPANVADGVQKDGSRQPTWNPVLFQPKKGPLFLFYKVGPNPREWWGEYKTSRDCGITWSKAVRLPAGILGPIKNKPVQLDNGEIISPTSIEGPSIGWRTYFERSTDGGKTWKATAYVKQPRHFRTIQPSILIHSQRLLQSIGRTKNGRLFETWSKDAGKTWSAMKLIDLPNPNSGTDAVTLADGRHVLVYNHSCTEKVRYPLNVAISRDGKNWETAAILDHEGPEQYSYPCVIQSRDGLVHVAYTWKRLKMKYAVIDPNRLQSKPILNSLWPVVKPSADAPG